MTPRLRRPAFISAALLQATLAAALAGAGCTPKDDGPPRDRPAFPTGLALMPDGDHLLVVGSNFDLTYRDGNLLAVDLGRVDEALAGQPATTVVTNAFVASIELPSFGDRPVVTSLGERAFLAARGDNLLIEIGVDSSGSFKLACEGDGGVAGCGGAPSALLLPGDDPLDVLVIAEERDEDGALTRVDGMAGLMSSPDVRFWRADLTRTDEKRLHLTGFLHLGDDVSGVRGIALFPRPGLGPVAFGLAQRTQDSLSGFGTSLVAFEPRTNAPIAQLDLTEATGSYGARALAVIPPLDDADAPPGLLVLLRQPDAIARIDVRIDAAGAPFARVAGVQSTCDDPSKLALALIDPDGDLVGDEVVRAYMTCFGDDAVLGVDVDTLATTEADRFFGRGPYDIAIHTAHDPPRAYVTFFSEGSVGVFDLVENGGPALQPRGKIAEPLPVPETGRE